MLKLKRYLYGLRQAPRYFFKHLKERLEKHDLVQSVHDPCLFLSKDLIVIVYVDDFLVYSRSQHHIDHFVTCMKEEDLWLRQEGTAEGYPGVKEF